MNGQVIFETPTGPHTVLAIKAVPSCFQK